jgi:Tfp pilus assembly protein PilV
MVNVAAPRWLRPRGVALLDALVAAIILGVSLAGIISLGGQAMRSQATGERIAIASMLADEQLNYVLARGPEDYAKRFPVEGSCDEPFGTYQFKLEFSGGGTGPFQVRATVSWDAGGVGQQSVMLETAVAPRPGLDPDPERRPEEPVERAQ